jgi:solute:Na+ symporter, SSS family
MFDYWALLSSIFIGTGFATFFLGIFSKRITGTGAFCGMLTGFSVAIANYVLYERGIVHYGSVMEMDFLGGTWGFIGNAVTAWVVSLGGKPKRDAELAGLVHSLRPVIVETSASPWYRRPIFLAVLVASLTIVLNLIFW